MHQVTSLREPTQSVQKTSKGDLRGQYLDLKSRVVGDAVCVCVVSSRSSEMCRDKAVVPSYIY